MGKICNHAAAVAFKLENARVQLKQGPSCTGVLCTWNTPGKKTVYPESLQDMFKIGEEDDSHILNNVIPFSINEIPTLFPDSVLCSSILEKPSLDLPLSILEAIDNSSENMENFMPILCNSMNDLSLANLEKETREQYKCPLWKQHRYGRITSSTAHAAKGKTSLYNLIFKSVDISHLPAIKYGLATEDDARKKFQSIMINEHTNFKINDSGLQLNKEFPLLGASPDGIIFCDCCGKGCLEIKCPLNFKETMPHFNNCQNLNKQFPYLERNGDTISLKKTHQYYYQVQMHMLLVKVNFCNFFVFGADNFLNIRVFRNELFLKHMTEKLTDRYKEILPSLKRQIQID